MAGTQTQTSVPTCDFSPVEDMIEDHWSGPLTVAGADPTMSIVKADDSGLWVATMLSIGTGTLTSEGDGTTKTWYGLPCGQTVDGPNPDSFEEDLLFFIDITRCGGICGLFTFNAPVGVMSTSGTRTTPEFENTPG